MDGPLASPGADFARNGQLSVVSPKFTISWWDRTIIDQHVRESELGMVSPESRVVSQGLHAGSRAGLLQVEMLSQCVPHLPTEALIV